MSLLAATALSALLLSCGKEEVSVEYVHTSYEKSDFPETISFNGGTFKFSFKADTVKLTRASEPIYLAWKYRVNVGEATGEPVEITSKTDAVGFPFRPTTPRTPGQSRSRPRSLRLPRAMMKSLLPMLSGRRSLRPLRRGSCADRGFLLG